MTTSCQVHSFIWQLAVHILKMFPMLKHMDRAVAINDKEWIKRLLAENSLCHLYAFMLSGKVSNRDT